MASARATKRRADMSRGYNMVRPMTRTRCAAHLGTCPRPSFRVAAVALALLVGGCTTHSDYLVGSDSLRVARATATAWTEDATSVPATRASDGKRVRLRTSAIESETPESEGVVRV